jgi:hypothetical protein
MSSRQRSTRLFVAVAGALALLYTGVWYWEAEAARQRVEAILATGASGKLALSGTRSAVGGFPFWVEIQIVDAVVAGLPRLPEARISAPAVSFRFHPFSPARWTLAARQGLAFDLPGPAGPLHVTAGEATAEAGTGRADTTNLAVRAGALGAAGPGLRAQLASIALKLEFPNRPTGESGAELVGFDLGLDGLALPRRLGPLGPLIQHIRLVGQIQGTVPRERLGEALAAWRDAGGTLELRSAVIDWDQVHLAGAGTLALDHDLQPEAAFSAEISNWTKMLDAMVDGGSMKPNDAEFAKLALALVGGTDGGTPLKMPITVQNGQVSVGKARIARLPPLAWP